MSAIQPKNSNLTYRELPRPAVIAHRGASKYAPENTIAAFELALRQGADAVELDVWLTKDKQVVVTHDTMLDRTTGFHGTVSSLCLDQIKTLDAGSYFAPEFRNEKIPTLSEVLETLDKKIVINIELKHFTSFSSALPEMAARIVEKHGYQEQVLFSSFNPVAILQVRRILPEIPTALLALRRSAGAFSRSTLAERFRYQALHVYYADITPDLVNRLHNGGKRLHVYTLNTDLDITHGLDLDVDGIITNDPPLAMRSIAEYMTKESDTDTSFE
jgi:glycerophosphoryl diester phosphodiesterase